MEEKKKRGRPRKPVDMTIGSEANPRHILGLSGGKDSTALAIYLKETRPEIFDKIELFFTDTGAELVEVYEYLDMLEEYLGKKIVRLKATLNEVNTVEYKVVEKDDNSTPFDDIVYKKYNGFLPSARARYCTRNLKLTPMKKWAGKDYCISYVGIRADEDRNGFDSKKRLQAVMPFVEDGLVLQDIYKLLDDTVGMPPYYKWRTRSGCYFCFFQRRVEFAILYYLYPEWFASAKEYETEHSDGRIFYWMNDKPLEYIEANAKDIIVKYIRRQYKKASELERSFMKLSLEEMISLVEREKIKEFIDTWDLKRLHDVSGENKDGCNICAI
jgi:hypothetical protein